MTKREIEITTADGKAEAGLFMPQGRAAAGVILYMDAFGLRPSLDAMAERLARKGYAVLVPDTLYRFQPYGPFDAATAFDNEESAKQIRSMLGGTTQAMTIADTGAFIAALDEAGITGPLGAVGYCMGGARALNAAAFYPDRIVAAASFHGGNLAGDGEDSPHRHAGRIRGRVYVGVSGVDRSFPPEQSAKLALALREAEIDHIIENYVGMGHGWAVPDHSVYDEKGAERHWKRLTEFFAETLKR
jgi:carboxymethylenebutenolidase